MASPCAFSQFSRLFVFLTSPPSLFLLEPFYTKIKFVLIFLLLTSRSLLDARNVFDDDSASALFLSFIRNDAKREKFKSLRHFSPDKRRFYRLENEINLLLMASSFYGECVLLTALTTKMFKHSKSLPIYFVFVINSTRDPSAEFRSILISSR